MLIGCEHFVDMLTFAAHCDFYHAFIYITLKIQVAFNVQVHLVSSDAKMPILKAYKHMLKIHSILHSTCSSFVLHHDPNELLFFFFCSVETFVSMATPCRKLPEPWENVFSQVI